MRFDSSWEVSYKYNMPFGYYLYFLKACQFLDTSWFKLDPAECQLLLLDIFPSVSKLNFWWRFIFLFVICSIPFITSHVISNYIAFREKLDILLLRKINLLRHPFLWHLVGCMHTHTSIMNLIIFIFLICPSLS